MDELDYSERIQYTIDIGIISIFFLYLIYLYAKKVNFF